MNFDENSFSESQDRNLVRAHNEELVIYKTLFENSPIGQILIRDGEIILVNQQLIQMYGYMTGQDLIGKRVNIIQPVRLHEEFSRLGKAREQGETVKSNYQTLGLKKNGEEFHIDVEVIRVTIISNYFILVYIRDLTYENQVLSHNKLLNHKFQQGLSTAPLPIMLRSIDDRILFINNKWENQSGFSLDDIPTVKEWLLKSKISDVQDDYATSNVYKQIIKQPGEHEDIITTKSGEKRVWRFTSTNIDKAIIEQENNLIMIMAVDVTDLINFQKKLEESNTRLEEFAHVVSHDLREPLRKIVGFTQILKDNIGDNLSEENSSFFDLVIGGASRMQMMISGILKYSSLTSQPMEIEYLSLLNLVEDIINFDLGDIIRETNAEINFDLKYNHISGHKEQIRQLFLNLIGNAIKFVKPNKQPTVEIKSRLIDQEWVEILISDNGIGIPNHQVNEIFKMFKRLHPRSEYAGTGIGLAICKKVVDSHHGLISVDSTINEGSIFKILLPIKLSKSNL